MPMPIEEIVFDGLEPLRIPDLRNGTESKQIESLLKTEVFRGVIEEIEVLEETPSKAIHKHEFLKEIQFKRVLIICNTVSSAQEVFSKLRKELGNQTTIGEIILIHSRLEKGERMRREALARSLMSRTKCAGGCGKGETIPIRLPLYVRSKTDEQELEIFCEDCAQKENALKRIDYVITIATQVVEAGLNITSDLLITECAPLDSLIQRIGRCARFPNEKSSAKIIYHEDSWRPYSKALVNEAWKILKNEVKRLPQALTNLIDSALLINNNYKFFQRGVPHEGLRSYLSYLEGSGFSTFTVDWQVLRTIRARPNVSLILVVPIGEIAAYIAEDEFSYTDLRKKGKFRHYNLIADLGKLSYNDLLKRLVELQRRNKYLLVDCYYVEGHSFSLDYRFAVENGEPKDLLTHRTPFGTQIIELKLIRALTSDTNLSYYYLVSPRVDKVSEGMYLLNPEFYDKTLGLRTGDEK
jgi:hypothetical protein